jgi:hypothetical protein
MDERAREVADLERIRSKFTAAAASCNKFAKAVVAATSELIEARRGRGRGKYSGGDDWRPPAQQ